MRSRPYPPDSAVARIWRGLRTGSIIVAATETDDAADLTIFAQELASRLMVFKLVLLDRQGGLTARNGDRLSFVEGRRINRALRQTRAKLRRTILRATGRALKDGVGSVNLAAPRDVYEELFSYIGTGTLFTAQQYGQVGPIAIDDFGEVEALIMRAQSEGFLLPRTGEANRGNFAVVLRVSDRGRASGGDLLTVDRALPPRTGGRNHRAVHAHALPGRRCCG